MALHIYDFSRLLKIISINLMKIHLFQGLKFHSEIHLYYIVQVPLGVHFYGQESDRWKHQTEKGV